MSEFALKKTICGKPHYFVGLIADTIGRTAAFSDMPFDAMLFETRAEAESAIDECSLEGAEITEFLERDMSGDVQ